MASIKQLLNSIQNSKLDIKNAIIAKGQDLNNVPLSGYAKAIEKIETGINLSGTTATSATVLAGYQFYTSGGIKTAGSIESLGASTIIPTTTNIEIPSGYYLNGTQIIQGDYNLLPENIVSGKSIFGVSGTLVSGTNISDTTAVASTVLAGYDFYNKDSIKTIGAIPSKPAQTYIPGVTSSIINAGQYLSGDQIIQGDQNLKPENIIIRYFYIWCKWYIHTFR